MYELVNYCEFDSKASAMYSIIHDVSEELNIGDITNVKDEDIKKCDILFSSSPCQTFSNIGSRTGGEEGSGTTSSLMWHNLRFIKNSNPKIVIWENVKNACSGKNKENFEKYCKAMEDLGYTNVWKILNPKNFGTPQNRERLFFVSIRNDLDATKFHMPSETNNAIDMFNYLEREVDEKYIVPDQVMRGYANKKSIFKKRWLIKKPGDCAYCLTAKSGRAVITNNYVFNDWDLYKNPPCELNNIDYMAENGIKVRALTPWEYFHLQNIPRKYYDRVKMAGFSDAQMYMRAGNGINVKVMYLIFRELYKAYPEVFEDMNYLSLFSGIGMPEIALDILYATDITRKKVA